MATTKPKSARDKMLEAKKAYDNSVKALTPKDDLRTRSDKLQAEVVALNTLIAQQQAYIDELVRLKADKKDIDEAKKNLAFYKESLPILQGQSEAARLRVAVSEADYEDSAAAAVTTAANTAAAADNAGALGNKSAVGALQYNASAVKEAYFSTRRDFISRIQAPMNQPTPVTQANELWTTAKGSKGMIVTSEQVLKAWNSRGNQPATADYFDHHNYGFQFQYNPGTVSMSYYTSPNVDVTMMTSGQEMFNLAGVSSSQGSVGFQVIINRIFDMQYYKPDGSLKIGNNNASTIYPVPPKTTEEFEGIYNKGTMYDIDALLRVLMGTTMNSYLRGEKTADMGWLPAIPVELYLGKSLKYLGTVNNLSINHIIFDARMVPIFSTLDIGFARLPDYPATKTPVYTPGGAQIG